MPGSNSLTLAWNLLATDGASPAFDKVAASADRAAASTEAAATKTEATGLSLSKLATVGAVAGVAFAAAAVKMASDFQRQMTLIQTQAGASADEVKKMTPAILSLAGQTAQAPEALATSLYHVESTGLRGAAALEAVKIAAEGARVGHADLEETTNALTATIASGMLPATESYAQAMGQLNTIVGSGDMKMSDLNEALGTGVLAITKQYGATLKDVGAALADFGDNNIRGADAATMFRMAVQAIAKPGVNAAEALGKIGLTVGQLQSDEQTGGLNKALIDLHGHLVSSGIDANQWGALMVDAFTKKAGGGITTLIGTFDRFEQKFAEQGKATASAFGADWAATTKTAAFQAAALKDNIDAMTISIGDHLLPIATGAMSWINGTAVPALKGLGSGAMDVAHWFGELPAPIKDTALALGGLALANAIGLTGALAGGISRVGSAFTGAGGAVAGFGDEMAVQSRLAVMDATSLSDVDRALGAVSGSAARAAGSLTAAQVSMTSGAFAGWDLALSGIAVEEDAVGAGAGRLGTAMSALAVQGQRAGSSILSALGGGTGLAIGATIILLPQLIDGFKLLTGNVIDSTAATQGFTQALEQTNGVIDANIGKTVAQQLQQNNLVGVFQKAGISAKDAVAGIEGNADAQHRVNQELQDYITKSNQTAGLHNADATAAATARAAYAQLADSFSTSAEAAKYFAGQMAEGSTNITSAGQAATDAAPKLEYAGSAAGMSADQIKAANKEWEAWIKNLSGLSGAFADPLTTYENLLSQKQQAEQASAQATAASTKSSKDSWKNYVQNVSVSLGEYADKLEGEIKNEQDWQKNLVTIAQRGGFQVAQQFADMGQKGADLTAQMANATNANFNRMATDMITQAGLAGDGSITTLDEKMRVMAEIGAEGGKATADSVSTALHLGINEVAQIAQQYGITLATGFEPVLSALGKQVHLQIGGPSGRGQVGALADGGYITGPGTGRSDSILSYLSNGEFVVNAAATAKHRPLLEALNAPKFAAGGFVTAADVPHPYSTAPFGALVAYPSDATMSTEYDAATAFLRSMAFAPGAPANVAANAALARQMAAQFYGWTGAEWNALYAVGQRESGWSNTAQNRSSTAYGIPQFLDSTWATVGLSKTSDPGTQIAGMLKYIQQRYRDPIGAWAHEMSAGWYDNGGYLMPGLTMAYNGTGKPERIRTAEQESALGAGTPVSITIVDRDGTFIDRMDGRIEQALSAVHAEMGA